MLIFLAAFLPTLFREKAAQVDSAGPSVVGLAVRHLERLALCAGYRSTRDRHCLASQELSSLLDLESPTWQDRKTHGCPRGPTSHPQNVPRESELGCTPHPRGVAQAWHPYRGAA